MIKDKDKSIFIFYIQSMFGVCSTRRHGINSVHQPHACKYHPQTRMHHAQASTCSPVIRVSKTYASVLYSPLNPHTCYAHELYRQYNRALTPKEQSDIQSSYTPMHNQGTCTRHAYSLSHTHLKKETTSLTLFE